MYIIGVKCLKCGTLLNPESESCPFCIESELTCIEKEGKSVDERILRAFDEIQGGQDGDEACVNFSLHSSPRDE